ncbi:unnamed protein product [Caenorhabditis brenneri]
MNSTENTSLNPRIVEHLRFVMTLDKLTEYLSAVICLPGAIFNAILIFLILKRTPPQMKSYAVYLLNFAFFDFATCIISFFSCQKVIFSGFSLIYVFHGPCKHISAWFCYFCHSFECHTLAHSQWILFGSFMYRYLVLRGETPSAKDLLRYSAAFYSMSFCFLVFYSFARSDSEELLEVMASLHPEYHYDDKTIWKSEYSGILETVESQFVYLDLVLSGNISVFSPIAFISIMYMTFPCVPIYCAILWFRHNTLSVLNNPNLNLSPVTRGSHQKLIRALTVQAAIPIFWLVASGIFTLAEFGFISGPIPENITFRLMDCIPMVSPIATILFIQPYRDGLLNFFLKGTGLFVPHTIGSSVVDVRTSKHTDRQITHFSKHPLVPTQPPPPSPTNSLM